MAKKLGMSIGAASAVTVSDARLENASRVDNPKNVFYKDILVAIAIAFAHTIIVNYCP
jgi:hypothetical protein